MPHRESLVSELGERHAVVGDPGTGVTRLTSGIGEGGEAPPDAPADAAPSRLRPPAATLAAPRSRPGEDLRELAARSPDDARLRIGVVLPDLPFAWERVGDDTVTTAERDALVETRRRDVDAELEPLLRLLASLGATDVHTHWLSTSVSATVEARHVETILAFPSLVSADLDERDSGVLSFNGDEGRNAMRLNGFISGGLRGQDGGRVFGTNPVRVGVLENLVGTSGPNNFLNRDHFGYWRDDSGTSDRILGTHYCGSSSCLLPPGYSAWEHGVWVTKILAGSIEDAQDPAITNPTERRRRSGMAPDTEIHFYSVGATCSAWKNGVEDALLRGVDVLNISAWISCSPGGYCPPTCDCSGLNATLQNATDAGMLVVEGVGNTQFGDPGVGNCNAFYPALRREVLVVGGVDTQYLDTPAQYDAAPIANWSNRGGMDSRIGGYTIPDSLAVVDVAAPGCWDQWYKGATGYQVGNACGTSFASPATAGAAALLRQAFYRYMSPPTARLLLTNMLLMGDGYHSDIGMKSAVGMDPRSGAGRVHMHYPSSASLISPWGWGWHSFRLDPGQERWFSMWDDGAESPSITQWKVAMTWREDDYTNMADIVLEVWDHCEGQPWVQVSEDWSYDIRKRITLPGSSIGGRCLWYRVRCFSAPAGRSVYVADYFHSGDPAEH